MENGSKIAVELQALIFPLKLCIHQQLHIHHIFLSCAEINDLLSNSNTLCGWHLRHWIYTILHLMDTARWPQVHVLPRALLAPVPSLVAHVANLHTVSLFHCGKDLPRWIMRKFLLPGYIFS